MPLPSSVKIKKNGIEYLNNVDACQYTLKELIRMALRDCSKLICKRTKQKIKKRTGIGARNIQYWVRSKQTNPDALVGIKPRGFYLGFMELGSNRMPKMGFLQETARENIDNISKIQAQYLSALNEEHPEIDSEDDYESGEND